MSKLVDICIKFIIYKSLILLLAGMTSFVNGNGYYTIVAPDLLISNSKFNVAVSVYKCQEPVLIEICLKGAAFDETKAVELPTDTSTDVEFDLPDLEEAEYNLLVKGLKGLLFRNSTTLTFMKTKPRALVEFDKPSKHYEHGQLLKFRLCIFKQNVCANEQNDNIKITLKSLHGYSVKDIQIINSENGYLFGTILLPEKNTYIKTNDWYFDVNFDGYNILSERLIIKKPQLHYYNVQIEAPAKVWLKDANIEVKVSASFVHAHAVDGHARLMLNAACYFDPATAHPAARTYEQQLSNGLAIFFLNLSYFEQHLDKFKGYCDIDLRAEVQAAHTYLIENNVKKIRLYAQRYDIKNTDDYLIYYEPNKAQNIKFSIKHLNGTVLADSNKLVTLICLQNIVYQKYPLDAPQPDEHSTAQARATKLKKLKFFAYLDESGNCSFKVLLPELEDIKGYSNRFIMQILFDKEEYDIQGGIYKKSQKYYDDYDSAVTHLKAMQQEAVLTMAALSNTINVGEACSFNINSTVSLGFLVNVLVLRGKIYSSKRFEFNEKLTSFNFTLKITGEMFPYLRMYAYSIDDKGNFVYAELRKPTQLNANTNRLLVNAIAEATPEQLIQLNVTTTANSSVTLLAYDGRAEFQHYSCDDASKTNFETILRQEYPWVVPRQGASYAPGSHSGVITLSNAHYDYKHSKYITDFDDSYDSASEFQFEVITPNKNDVSTIASSSDFEFFSIKSSKNGEQTWNVTVPNCITNWLIEVKSRNDDLSIAPIKKCIKLNVVKNLLLYVTTQNAEYQKGENIPVQIRVSNYGTQKVLAKLSITERPNEFETSNITSEFNQTLTVDANNSAGIIFNIRSKIVGTITLQVIATSSIGNDKAEIKIEVLPKGKLVTIEKSNLPTFGFNLFEIPNDSKTYVPELPANVVTDSQRLVLHIQSDVLQIFFGAVEPARLIEKKTLEHVILNYLNNYLWLKYQQSRERIRGKAQHKLQRTIHLNYQEILSYRLKDGSFKLNTDIDVGSIWLTSYALLCIADKIEVDEENVIAQGLEFLASQQATNGSFMDTGTYEIITTMNQNVLTTLTLLAFAKNDKQQKYRKVIQSGLDFLQQQKAEIDERLERLIGVVREKSGVGYSTRSAEFRRLTLDEPCEGVSNECRFYENAFASGLCMVDAILDNYDHDIDMLIEVQTSGLDAMKSVIKINKNTSQAFVLETPYGTESVTIKGKGLGVFLVFLSYSYHTHSQEEFALK